MPQCALFKGAVRPQIDRRDVNPDRGSQRAWGDFLSPLALQPLPCGTNFRLCFGRFVRALALFQCRANQSRHTGVHRRTSSSKAGDDRKTGKQATQHDAC